MVCQKSGLMRAVLAMFVMLGVSGLIYAGSAEPVGYTWRGQFFPKGTANEEVRNPSDLVIENGITYIADSGNRRIKTFRRDSTFQLSWESDSNALDFGPNGRLYVSDPIGNRIRVFTGSGGLLANWHSVDQPTGVAVDDSTGNVFVSEIMGVRKLDSQGNQVGCVWTGPSSAPLKDTASITVGGGHVYVANKDTRSIYQFTTNGTFVRSFRGVGTAGELDTPLGVEFFNNRVNVVDSPNHRMVVFSADGKFIDQFGFKLRCGDVPFNARSLAHHNGEVFFISPDAIVAVNIFAERAPVAQRYNINFTTAPKARILWDVDICRGVQYLGTMRGRPEKIRVDGRRFRDGVKVAGNHAKVLNVFGGTRLTLTKAGTNTPNPEGGDLEVKFNRTFGDGKAKLLSVRVSNVTTPNAKIVLYGVEDFIATYPVPQTGPGGSVVVPINRSNVGFMQVTVRNAFAIDDVRFEDLH
jgi:hypothetical protein